MIAAPPRLRVDHLFAGRDAACGVRGASLSVVPGEVVALVGRNGSGKTSLLRAVAGVLAPRGGCITLDGVSIGGRGPAANARAGVSLLGRESARPLGLTVADHLRVAGVTGRADRWSWDRIVEIFPRLRALRARRDDALSSAERQMLAIGRALASGPTVLLLDEPAEGLATACAREIATAIRAIAAAGIATLFATPDAAHILAAADRCYIIENGEIVTEATAREMRDDADLRRRYLDLEPR